MTDQMKSAVTYKFKFLTHLEKRFPPSGVGLVEGAEVIQEAVEGHGGRERGAPLLQRRRRAGHAPHWEKIQQKVWDFGSQ